MATALERIEEKLDSLAEDVVQLRIDVAVLRESHENAEERIDSMRAKQALAPAPIPVEADEKLDVIPMRSNKPAWVAVAVPIVSGIVWLLTHFLEAAANQ